MSKYLAAVPDLTDEEFAAVTAAFVERLDSAMSTAGCNDVFEDEFPKSVCEKYRSDTEILTAWRRRFLAPEVPESDS